MLCILETTNVGLHQSNSENTRNILLQVDDRGVINTSRNLKIISNKDNISNNVGHIQTIRLNDGSALGATPHIKGTLNKKVILTPHIMSPEVNNTNNQIITIRGAEGQVFKIDIPDNESNKGPESMYKVLCLFKSKVKKNITDIILVEC